jgi:hypothetical protein
MTSEGSFTKNYIPLTKTVTNSLLINYVFTKFLRGVAPALLCVILVQWQEEDVILQLLILLFIQVSSFKLGDTKHSATTQTIEQQLMNATR